MAGFNLKSIRAKLTLTTMAVMAAVLAVLVFVAYFGAEQTLLASVDTELRNRANGMAEPHGGPPPPGGPPMLGLFGLGDRPPPRPRMEGPGLKPAMIPVQPNGTLRLDHDQPYDMDAALRAVGNWAGYSDATINGSTARLYTRPRIENGRVTGVVQVPYDTSDIYRSLSNLKMVLLVIVIPLGVLLAGLSGMFLVGRLISPLRDMRAKADDLSAHNLSERLPVRGEDEFAALANTLNAMLGRLELAFEHEQATMRQLEEAIAQQRRFTADASHELKTPLAVIKANSGLVLQLDGSKNDYREAVREIDAAATRMNRLVADLLVLARADAGHLAQRFERCDLGDVVDEAIGQVPAADSRVHTQRNGSKIPIQGSPDDLARVFVNLIDNALRHSPDSKPVEVDVKRLGEFASVTVKDSGPGIAPEHLEHIFERFYRVDASRASETGGTGLGLAICKGVVHAHGGQISVASTVGAGTTFTVTVPLALEKAA